MKIQLVPFPLVLSLLFHLRALLLLLLLLVPVYRASRAVSGAPLPVTIARRLLLLLLMAMQLVQMFPTGRLQRLLPSWHAVLLLLLLCATAAASACLTN
jgi:hypothetical protein